MVDMTEWFDIFLTYWLITIIGLITIPPSFDKPEAQGAGTRKGQ